MVSTNSSAGKTAILLYASSEASADALYFAGAYVPDPFIALGLGKKRVAVASALEFARLRKESAFDEVLPLEELQEKTKKRFRKKQPEPCDIIRLLAEEYHIGKFIIPGDFPAGLALKLNRAGVKLEAAEGSLFPEREIKSDAEAAAISEGNRAAAAGLQAAEKILRAAATRKNNLSHQGRPLTSERVREAVDTACLQQGAVAQHTIVAGGNQACDPHCEGTGILRANELIIVDVFPRVKKTGYHGDMTRTFLKGRASEEQKRLVAAVRAAQLSALKEIRPGANGKKIWQKVVEFFCKAGYETKRIGNTNIGFFHGVGHGLGLEVHEPPRISRVDAKLKSGHVVTVEPGLYYPGLGGCRLEDVVRVNRCGCEMLSKYQYRWEIS